MDHWSNFDRGEPNETSKPNRMKRGENHQLCEQRLLVASSICIFPWRQVFILMPFWVMGMRKKWANDQPALCDLQCLEWTVLTWTRYSSFGFLKTRWSDERIQHGWSRLQVFVFFFWILHTRCCNSLALDESWFRWFGTTLWAWVAKRNRSDAEAFTQLKVEMICVWDANVHTHTDRICSRQSLQSQENPEWAPRICVAVWLINWLIGIWSRLDMFHSFIYVSVIIFFPVTFSKACDWNVWNLWRCGSELTGHAGLGCRLWEGGILMDELKSVCGVSTTILQDQSCRSLMSLGWCNSGTMMYFIFMFFMSLKPEIHVLFGSSVFFRGEVLATMADELQAWHQKLWIIVFCRSQRTSIKGDERAISGYHPGELCRIVEFIFDWIWLNLILVMSVFVSETSPCWGDRKWISSHLAHFRAAGI